MIFVRRTSGRKVRVRFSLICIIGVALILLYRVIPSSRRVPFTISPFSEKPRQDDQPSSSQKSEDTASPFAYVFYATSPEYACSVLINIDRLNTVFNTTHRILVLVRPDLDSSYLSAFTTRGSTVIPYEPPELGQDGVSYYEDVLLKLVSFRLHHYIPSLSRILVLDADQLILKSLDHLFSLPDVDVAAPRAYWQDNGVTTALLLVCLSDRLWGIMANELATITRDTYDMDLINRIFEKTVMVLPGNYATLNSHWETIGVPPWWRGIEPPPDPDNDLPTEPDGSAGEPERPPPPEYSPPSQPDALNEETIYINSDDPPTEPLEPAKESEPENGGDASTDPIKSFEEPGHKNVVDANPKNRTLTKREESAEVQSATIQVTSREPHRLDATLKLVYEDVSVLHFTAVGKPWYYTTQEVRGERPQAHELLAEQFRTWRKAAVATCPGWGDHEL
ncbi:MAG: hypothetical protein M1837_007298 [Sclerophora amabilis]|nr:MAG: hypothetical protein M1837_007298 [Sclerophora amabilis]